MTRSVNNDSYLVIEIDGFPDEVDSLSIYCTPHIIFLHFFPTRLVGENVLYNIVAVVRIDAIVLIRIINECLFVDFRNLNSYLAAGFLFRT